LAIFEEAGDCIGQGKAYNGLGGCYEPLDNYTKAIELH
jgi:hypothetical protein